MFPPVQAKLMLRRVAAAAAALVVVPAAVVVYGTTPASAEPTVYEAENATTSQAAAESTHAGFTGTGYVNYVNVAGGYVEWRLGGATGGRVGLTFRYANGVSAARPTSVSVNGATQVANLSFPATGAWTTWRTVTTTVTLAAGANTIRVTATGAEGGPNLDSLTADVGGGDTIAPTAPGNPRASDLTCSSVTFSWDASTDNVGVVAYDVFHDGQLIKSVAGDTLSTSFPVVENAEWGLYVQARDAAGNPSESSDPTVTINVPPCGGPDTQPPTAPGNLRGSASGTTVTLNWNASADNRGVTQYQVFRNGAQAGVVNGTPPATTFNDSALTVGTPYTYYVVAKDAAGNTSARSNEVTITPTRPCTTVCDVTTVTNESDIPWGLVTLPDGTILYSRRDAHDIIHLNPTTGSKKNIGSIPGAQSTNGEGGTMGLEINPVSFNTDNWLYIMTTTGSDNRVVRMKYDRTADTLLTNTSQVLISGITRNKFHNGGRLRFQPDGRFLFISTGDAQSGDRAQNRNSLNGKILRINPDGSIPQDNPFGNAVWSYGHRNPQGLAFDANGNLWEQEFGNSRMDETNLIVRGGNYGWPMCEGTAGSCGGFVAPKRTYPVGSGSCSGITVVRNALYVACQRGTRLVRLVITGTSLGSASTHFQGTYGRIRTVEPAPGGNAIWMTTTNGDKDSTPNNSNTRIFRVTVG